MKKIITLILILLIVIGFNSCVVTDGYVYDNTPSIYYIPVTPRQHCHSNHHHHHHSNYHKPKPKPKHKPSPRPNKPSRPRTTSKQSKLSTNSNARPNSSAIRK